MRYFVWPLLLIWGFYFAKGNQEYNPKDRLIVETLIRLNRLDLSENEKWHSAVQRYTRAQRGKDEYLDLVDKFNLRDEVPKIVEDLFNKPKGNYASMSVQIIFKFNEQSKLENSLNQRNNEQLEEIIKLVGFITSEEAKEFVSRFELRRKKSSNLSTQPGIKKINIEDVASLVKQVGIIKNGEVVYNQFCAICHKAGSIGMDFGPNLTEIGSKLPKSELYLAVLKPNDGISFDYEGWTVFTKDGLVFNGILSESDNEFTIRMIGGVVQIIEKKRVLKKEKMNISLMPMGLHLGMTRQQLINLVEFLTSLKS